LERDLLHSLVGRWATRGAGELDGSYSIGGDVDESEPGSMTHAGRTVDLPQAPAAPCSKCHAAPRLPDQRWCRSCLTVAQRARRAAARATRAPGFPGVTPTPRIAAAPAPSLRAVTRGIPAPTRSPGSLAVTPACDPRVASRTADPTASTRLFASSPGAPRYTTTPKTAREPASPALPFCEFCGLAFRPHPDRRGQRFGCNCCGSAKPHISTCGGHDTAPLGART